MPGALLALHSFLLVAKRCRTFASIFSPRIFHLQTIIIFYIVELGKALHMPWVPLYRSSIRVVDVNALQQQRQSFDGNAFSSSASYSTATLSSSSAIRLLYEIAV
jgi:hypothetical protein